MADSNTIVRIGIIGCGEISQVAHIPNINFLSHNLAHCATKVLGGTPRTTTDAAELCASPDVDAVLIANADAYHVEHGILALQHGKYCLIEKPAASCFRDIDRLIEAEKSSAGKVFVGTMRRYATAFVDAVSEVGGMSKIQYARVRDIIGQHPFRLGRIRHVELPFQGLCLNSSNRRGNVPDCATQIELGASLARKLGTHSLSAMRELLGMPQRVSGAVVGTLPGIFAVLFQYDGFPVSYESGLSGVPQFDAHVEVYSPDKIVRVEFDTPYVKGLPVTLTIRERVGEDGFQERRIRKTYTHPYTLELLEFYDCVVGGRTPKTSAADARNDVELFRLILQTAAASGSFK
ncbi:hypothetical protein C8A03DRAFT_46627 [Achaetomium macrosporum]|uniref:Gfo/Idh/MocA-like oxidoreductase N-terminal domain-containing protein n=1 Tax=Achaetomium macrosporum TaxID=79813 RepID=A0AAN7H4X4_9PEZI|nr:hypothetical protein C8A03DRAFT_46627 [Achaetomium macrosporum]